MGRFHVVDQLGAGAFGRALLCRDKASREFVVIKEIRCADKAARAEARREAELLRKHSHPNVCRYIASFADDQRKRFYIVLEHCDGGDLSQAIARRRSERRPYPEAQAAALFVMICLALRHVHARRIVHRDVKAANVFLTKRGIAKLGDFGVSRQLDASVALASTRVGTPYYLAPEIFEGRPYGRAADVWSLGVLFYEILVLRVPFTAPSLAALCRAITSSRAPNVIGYSSACAELVASLLHKDVEKRPLTDALVKHVYVRKYMSGALEARSGRVVDDETTDDDSDDASAAIERRVASLVEPDLPAGLADALNPHGAAGEARPAVPAGVALDLAEAARHACDATVAAVLEGKRRVLSEARVEGLDPAQPTLDGSAVLAWATGALARLPYDHLVLLDAAGTTRLTEEAGITADPLLLTFGQAVEEETPESTLYVVFAPRTNDDMVATCVEIEDLRGPPRLRADAVTGAPEI